VVGAADGQLPDGEMGPLRELLRHKATDLIHRGNDLVVVHNGKR
jgi:hypothetical protein